ncbi:tyrosine-type recombinase/integrase [Hydrogenimonas urashimensis]|uniref:tyrosine-type recombinase/integrase n=1 Tax=Hydrogenimonas urashimensis TaxID=2740515 RepID=UPI0019162A03|nr:tyrosine-type recombinase/integrase [Hydrogenimonas urashimensis]
MANKNQYSEKIEGIRGLKATPDFKRFRYRCKIDGQEFTKTFDYSDKEWTKRDRIRNARRAAEAFRDEKATNVTQIFSSDTKLDIIAKEYFDNACEQTEWTAHRKRQYELYIQPFIGKKPTGKIIRNDIDRIRASMEQAGRSKQNANGCSPRTIHKVLFQVLKPILVYAQENGAIDTVPAIKLPGKRQRKKTVTNGMEKLALLYHTVMKLYKNDPFYRALFLFAIQGRRWNEIRTLRWENIHFEHNYYTIEAQYNKIGEDQHYDLWHPIYEALESLEDRKGLIFKSPVTGKELHSPRKQLNRIKKASGMDNLTMHLFRHIAVTAMGENGVPGTVLSAALGHVNSATVDKHYRTINHLKGSKDATAALEKIIDVEVEE